MRQSTKEKVTKAEKLFTFVWIVAVVLLTPNGRVLWIVDTESIF